MRRIPVLALLAIIALIAAGCGSMSVLPDGRVLFLEMGVKGRVYDPATGQTTAVGAMQTPRVMSSWTALQDGRVLVAGGGGADNTVLDTAELFDPATMTSAATGSMTTGRALQSATLLADGRVLVAGGGILDTTGTGTGTSFDSAELYDPATGTFTATGSMTTGRILHVATRLADGRVLIVGGAATPSAEIYDPATGAFSAVAAPPDERLFSTSVLLGDGRVMEVGGVFGAGDPTAVDQTAKPIATALLYDPATDTWTPTGDLGVPRLNASAVALPDGRVLIAGGSQELVSVSGAPAGALVAELYDPTTGTFTPTGSLHKTHGGFAVLLGDGRVLIAGAESESQNASDLGKNPIFTSGEIWDPSTGEWTPVAFKVPAKHK